MLQSVVAIVLVVLGSTTVPAQSEKSKKPDTRRPLENEAETKRLCLERFAEFEVGKVVDGVFEDFNQIASAVHQNDWKQFRDLRKELLERLEEQDSYYKENNLKAQGSQLHNAWKDANNEVSILSMRLADKDVQVIVSGKVVKTVDKVQAKFYRINENTKNPGARQVLEDKYHEAVARVVETERAYRSFESQYKELALQKKNALCKGDRFIQQTRDQSFSADKGLEHFRSGLCDS